MKNLLIIISLIISTNVYAALTAEEALNIVKTVDDKQRNSGDYKADCFIREVEKDKEPRVFQANIYRRDKDNKFMILFTKPRKEEGKGYLKIDKNLWMYDPNTGNWERKTEREKIAGTNSRRSDLDESRLVEEYDIKYLADEVLGKYSAYKMELIVKKNIDVAYPKLMLWIDAKEKNILKREEYSLSGKLMRTSYYPEWDKKYSQSKKADVSIPKEISIYDNIEKGNKTTIAITKVDLNTLQDNIFTKAWMESKKR